MSSFVASIVDEHFGHFTRPSATVLGFSAIFWSNTISEGDRLCSALDPPLAAGPLQGVTIDAKTMVSEYFETMGWDPRTGRPSREKLQELGLGDIVKD